MTDDTPRLAQSTGLREALEAAREWIIRNTDGENDPDDTVMYERGWWDRDTDLMNQIEAALALGNGACKTCDGRGEVGGFVSADSGYQTDPCPICRAPGNGAVEAGWRDGAPNHPWDKEWFIAKTTYGDRVVLRALPEEWSYDFTTADDTYIKRDKIKSWMQFPDSNYIAPAPPAALDPVTVEALTAIKHLVSTNRTHSVLDQIQDICDRALAGSLSSTDGAKS